MIFMVGKEFKTNDAHWPTVLVTDLACCKCGNDASKSGEILEIMRPGCLIAVKAPVCAKCNSSDRETYLEIGNDYMTAYVNRVLDDPWLRKLLPNMPFDLMDDSVVNVGSNQN